MNHNWSTASRGSKRAFTLVELLAVVAVVALLVCLCLPALARVRGQTTQAQCAANLKQFALAFEIYGNEHSGQISLQPPESQAWPWDLPAESADLLILYGAQRPQMYCPANPGQNVDGLWNYYPSEVRVIGYAMTLPGTVVSVDNQNSTLFAHTATTDLPGGIILRVLPSQRVMVADATLSQMNQNIPKLAASYQWFNIPGGYTAPGWTGHRTSHMSGTLPVGGNMGMLDGHVEWRSFTNMLPRTYDGQGYFAPPFWW